MPLYIPFPDWIKPEIIPGLPPRWYGLMYLLAFIITYALFRVQVKERGLEVKKDEISNFFFWGIVGLLIGARILATTIYDTTGRYAQAPWLIIWPFDEQMNFTGLAGMSFHGGFLGLVVAWLIYSHIKKIDLMAWGDMIATAVPLGYTLGRLGNFINGELYGRVTTASWGVLFPGAEKLPVSEPWVQDVMKQTGITTVDTMVNLPRHPSQLYEAFGEGLLLWLIFWFLLKGRAPFRGFMMGMYIIGYGVARFIVEYFRTPDRGLDFPIMFEPVRTTSHLFISPVNFSTGQILSSLMILGGLISLVIFYLIDKRKKAMADAEPAEKGRERKKRNKIK